MNRTKTQKQLVMDFIAANGESTIGAIEAETSILRPNIRRILGTGAKQGIFERIAPGVYAAKTEKGNIAYVEAQDALISLPRLVADGWKFTSVFLDIPYFSKSLIGGNRGIVDYDFIFARQFATVMQHIAQLMANPDCHVYLMLSGAKSAQREMSHYQRAANAAGFKLIQEGTYKKLYNNGKAATNVRGQEASPERLLLYTLSGRAANYGCDLQFDFSLVRPTGYQTEKAAELCSKICQQSTLPGDWVIDPFAGSGVFGEQAILQGRNAYLIEKNPVVVERLILNRIK